MQLPVGHFRLIKREETTEAQLSPWFHKALELFPKFHTGRHSEWALARLCLQQLLTELGEKDITTDKLALKNFQHLIHYPHWQVAISHSKTAAAVWCVPKGTFKGMGLDIEAFDRTVPEGVQSRMLNPQDDTSLSALTRWTIKEAIYKSLPHTLQTKLWLNSLAVLSATTWQASPITGEYSSTLAKEHVCSLAWH